MLRKLDVEALARDFRAASPFPNIVIDDLLEADAAREIEAAFPAFEDAEKAGKGFETVNEHRKVQVTEYEKFPALVKKLSDALASPEFMGQVEQITGIKPLVWDPSHAGGGMHQTAQSGILDVHVDFNRLDQLYRRLNILVYLNSTWNEAWGGMLELWDRDVKVCHHRIQPKLGRAVIFETSEISFHGVTKINAPPQMARKSFAAYYYTREAPSGYEARDHSTIFKARPDERIKRYVRMPLETAQRRVQEGLETAKQKVKAVIGRS